MRLLVRWKLYVVTKLVGLVSTTATKTATVKAATAAVNVTETTSPETRITGTREAAVAGSEGTAAKGAKTTATTVESTAATLSARLTGEKRDHTTSDKQHCKFLHIEKPLKME